MVLLRRNGVISRLRLNIRLYSNPAISLSDENIFNFDSLSLNIKSNQEPCYKIKNLLTELPSNSYINDVLEPGSKFVIGTTNISKNSLIKYEIYKLIHNGNYQELLQLMTNYVNLDIMDIKSNLNQQEIAYIMRQLIEYQIKLLIQYATRTNKNQPDDIIENSQSRKKHIDVKFIEVKRFINEIRNIYSNLIFDNKSNAKHFIYDKSKRANFFNTPHSYQLSILDYENLILLELRNNKLDLASKWFQRFEQQFGPNSNEKFTLNLWILKLQTYCGGLPNLWKVDNSELYYTKAYSSKRSNFKSEVPFITIFNDFLKFYNPSLSQSNNNRYIIDKKFNQTLIHSIGYSRNLEYLRKYIELTWGINETGLNKKFKLPKKSNLNYPDIDIIKAILISFSFNGQFYEAMKYINHFQNVYDIDTDSQLKSANSLWEQIFKWCDITTNFDEKRALQYYLQQSNLVNPKKRNVSIQEVQKDVNFDYEGYLTFIENLKNERITVHDQLWKLYLKTNSRFSLPIAHQYYKFLIEDINQNLSNINDQYFEFLTYLSNQYHRYNVPTNSFNKRHEVINRVNNTDDSIRNLYINVMKSFIDHKWKSTYAGQCQPLISKWSLDTQMKQELNDWFVSDRLPKYQEMIDKKRHEFMIGLRTDDDKEDDSFLNLL